MSRSSSNSPLVGIVMGSQSDLRVMKAAAKTLAEFEVPYELTIVSAHRTPERLMRYGRTARERGLKAVIAGAGGAAHLPGMLAAVTTLPVIGVPVKSSNSIDGWDSVLSILQMPSGVPVATVALDASKNAALLALQILSTSDESLASKLDAHKSSLKEKVEEMISSTRNAGFPNSFDD